MPRTQDDPLPGAPEPWAPSEMPAFRSRAPYLMTQMIAAQPALAERLIGRLATDEAVGQLAKMIRELFVADKPVAVTGCGTSEHAAMGVAALLNEALEGRARGEVRSRDALDAIRHPPADGLLIGISHEGGTTAIGQALRAARQAGARTALVTVSGGSPAAQVAELVVRTGEQDQSWCHTVGYLSPLLAGVVLAAHLKGSRPDALGIRAILEVSADPHAAASLAGGLTGTDRIIVAGTGPDYVSARELALKITEGARLPAAAHDLETVLHGHLAAATRWTGLVVILSADTRFSRKRATRLFAAARVLSLPTAGIVGDALAKHVTADQLPAGRVLLPRPGRLRGVAGSLLGAAIPLQLVAERLARARGVNPDTLGREDPAQAAAHA